MITSTFADYIELLFNPFERFGMPLPRVKLSPVFCLD
jgi:hypothetical protein